MVCVIPANQTQPVHWIVPAPFYTDGDGIAELTALPTVSQASVAAGRRVTVQIPVDSDTGYIQLMLADQHSTHTQFGYNLSTNFPAIQVVVYDFPVLITVPANTYQLAVVTAKSAVDYKFGLHYLPSMLKVLRIYKS